MVKQKSIWTALACCSALIGVCVLVAACEDDDDKDTTVDAGHPLLAIDACIKGGRETGALCSDREMCNCNNACGGNFFEFEVPDTVPDNLKKRIQDYNQFEDGIFYCYKKCGQGQGCPSGSECIVHNEETDREIAICSPLGTIKMTNVPVKLIKLGAGFDIMYLADSLERLQQAITQLQDPPEFDIGEQTVPRDLNQVAAIYNSDKTGVVSAIAINVRFQNLTNSEEWNILTVINGARWSTGAVLDAEEDDFMMMALHRECKNKQCTNWIEGVSHKGKITLGEVKKASDDPTKAEVSTITSLDVTLALDRVGNRPTTQTETQTN